MATADHSVSETIHITGVTNTFADGSTPGVSTLFGTEPIQLAAGDPVIGVGTEANVPEPGAWWLATGGLTLICLGKKQMERSRRARALAGRKE